MFFLGIDLAWSTKNGTGLVLLEGDKKQAKLVKHALAYSDKEIMDFVKENIGEKKALIAIDAPLTVPNETGRRLAEEEVGKLFRKYNAGAHPANRTRLSSWTGSIRGEDITNLLTKEGFKHDPNLKQFEETRKTFEVYPHPSIVVLFNLPKILQYKNKPHRDYEFRWNEFRKYQEHLKELEKAKPSLKLPPEITSRSLKGLKGNALKDYEDTLDGVLCAYIAYYYWANPSKCAILGSVEKGYILTPVFDGMLEQLKQDSLQTRLI